MDDGWRKGCCAENQIQDMKHAFLILAHTDFDMLKRLVESIDDERNDIYIHFDAKVISLPEILTRKSKLHILDNRVDVRWADVSVVEGEYALFEKAVENGPYQYYHLLSGADLPLKSQDYIHDFFDENDGKEFIGYTFTEISPEVERKVMRWHLFPKEFRKTTLFKKALRAGFIRIQELLGIRRNKGIAFTKGSQWVSVTQAMAELFIRNKDWALKTFTHTFCSDEIVMQTLCWNSPLKENIFCTTDDRKGCMRVISWFDGEMRNWTEEDLCRMKQSEFLFARKFISGKK